MSLLHSVDVYMETGTTCHPPSLHTPACLHTCMHHTHTPHPAPHLHTSALSDHWRWSDGRYAGAMCPLCHTALVIELLK